MKIRITGLVRDLREITPAYIPFYKDQISGELYLEIKNTQDKIALINLLRDIWDRQ